jgi:polyisoprenyl-phosphate glycosyltransferase
LMSLVGLFFACCGFLYALLIAILRLTGQLPRLGLINPLMVVVLVMGGTQMLMLGIIGEYIWRTLAQARDRPLYVVDRVYEAAGKATGAADEGDRRLQPPPALAGTGADDPQRGSSRRMS